MKAETSGAIQLKNHIKTGDIAKLYVIYGEESYLKEFYLRELISATVETTFRQFNLLEFNDKALTPELLNEAVESCPAMSNRKLVLVRDFDLYKAPAVFKEYLLDLFSDLPDYLCLVFYYDIVELKQDKRQKKLHALLEKNACFAEFSLLAERELMTWVRRRLYALNKEIDDETCSYFIFTCGSSMTNLITEIEKVAALSTVNAINRYHIDTVCTRVLDAVVFELTDAIADKRFTIALYLLDDLLAQKNDEIQIFSTILRHLQRIYGAKLIEISAGGERALMDMVGAKSPFYARKLSSSARKLTLPWLRKAILLAAETDAALKSTSGDKRKQIELVLLQMATNFGSAVSV